MGALSATSLHVDDSSYPGTDTHQTELEWIAQESKMIA